jgi:hypothetical protein
VLVTAIELAVLFVARSPRHPVVPLAATRVVAERVVFVVPALPGARVAERRVSSSTFSNPVEAPAPGPVTTLMTPRDSAAGAAPSPRILSPPVAAPPAGTATPGGSAAAGPILAPRGFNPSAPFTRRIIDSVLDSLNANMPALIWARVPTQAERDAAYKEGALAMRLSGRTLLVPADPHLASGVSLPSLFSRRKQRDAARARIDSILAENMQRLARLRARARRDSLQRADSLSSATPRRLPDARTPA